MVIMDVYVIRPNTGQMNPHDKSHHIIMVIMDVYVICPNTGQLCKEYLSYKNVH
jgi:hypothetical protein